MNYATLAFRSLRHYRGRAALLWLGTTLTGVLLTGPFLINDSVRHTLESRVDERIGRTRWLLEGGRRYFRSELADHVAKARNIPAVPVLILEGIVSLDGGRRRENGVQLVGVPEGFSRVYPRAGFSPPGDGTAFVNRELASGAGLETEDVMLVRFRKASSLPGDSPLSPEGESAALRLRVADVISPERFGRFSLRIDQRPRKTVFLPIDVLAREAGIPGRANAVLVPEGPGGAADEGGVGRALERAWSLEDASLYVRKVSGQGVFELRSRNVFLPESVTEPLKEAFPAARPVLTYLVNRIRAGKNETPYSFVSAPPPGGGGGMSADEIVLVDWLAEDLGAAPGDAVELEYFVINPANRLETRTRSFRAASVIPLAGEAADPSRMPDLPGVAEAGNCRDWETGIPVDLSRIREKDERYWDDRRGTPKAYIALETAREIWSNPYGGLTAIRFPLESRESVLPRLKSLLPPKRFGMGFRDVRREQLKAGRDSTDFSGLFFGLSFFIVVSSLILVALSFGLSVMSRRAEIATLRALGFPPGSLRVLFLLEGAAIAVLGALAALPASAGYVKAVLYGLTHAWYGAVQMEEIAVMIRPSSLAAGFLLCAASSTLAMLFTLNRILKSEIVRARGAGDLPSRFAKHAFDWNRVAVLSLPGVIAGLLWMGTRNESGYSPALFFLGGGAMLAEGLLAARMLFSRAGSTRSASMLSLTALGGKNVTRNPGRSLSIVALLSIGVFLVVSVSLNQKDPYGRSSKRSSGTGGFDFYLQTTHPLRFDPDTADGRREYFPNPGILDQARFVSMSLKEGDDASCLNLNRTLNPRVLGVDPGALARREAFTMSGYWDGLEGTVSGWEVLRRDLEEGVIPAVADMSVIRWSMGKKPGETLEEIDEYGRPVRFRLVAGLANSVFQGSVLISRRDFVRHFPSSGGYRVFLVEGFENRAKQASRKLSRVFRDYGVEIETTADRLARFNAVENTYLSIFLALGGLGLILGTFGLGLILAKSILERRGELALLRALGFSKCGVLGLLVYEYCLVLFLGVGIGAVSGFLAVIPSVLSPGSRVPWAVTGWVLSGIVCAGVCALYAAVAFFGRGSLLSGLRDE